MQTILVTGGSGQVGQAIARLPWAQDVTLLLPPRVALDLADPASVQRYLDGPSIDLIVNSGAYTAVDRAESEVAVAFAVNAQAPAILADYAREASIPLIQFVDRLCFSGAKPDPYVEDDPVAPLGFTAGRSSPANWRYGSAIRGR